MQKKTFFSYACCYQLVDDEVFLHSESDPRYKGSAIPSKAFKFLQTMTDGAPNSVQAGKLSCSCRLNISCTFPLLLILLKFS
jgi:hypothetical protein